MDFVRGIRRSLDDLLVPAILVLIGLVIFKIGMHYMNPVAAQQQDVHPAVERIQVPVGVEYNFQTLPNGKVVPFTDHEERCPNCRVMPLPPELGEVPSDKKPMKWIDEGDSLLHFVQYCPECGDQTQRWQPGYGPYETPGRERFGRQWEGRQWEGRLGDGVWRSPVPEGFDGAPRAWGDRSQYYEYWDNENSRYSRPHYGPPARFFAPPPKIRGYTPEYEYRYQGEYKNQNRMGY